jgi:hypothetical protein
MFGNRLTVRCSTDTMPDSRSQRRRKQAASRFSGRIRLPVSLLPTLAALTPSPWTGPPSAIAALQTSAQQSNGPAPALQLCRALSARKAMTAGRNPLQDWQAPDNAAPAADSIRRIWRMTCSWTTARIWPLGHDTVAPPLCDPPLLARRDEEQANLLAGSAMGQGGLWISAPLCAARCASSEVRSGSAGAHD